MKNKFLILCMLMITFTTGLKVNASDGITNTGHSDIVEMDFVSNYNYENKFLVQYSDKEITEAYKNVARTAFGWSMNVLVNEKAIWFVSEIIFSKSNRTDQKLTYEYTLKEGDQTEVINSKSGTITAKISGKVKGVSVGIESGLKKDVTTRTKSYYEEKISFDVVVNPGKVVQLRVYGKGKVSNGVGKYYLCGIPFKKGTWEYITKETEYYELYEKNI